MLTKRLIVALIIIPIGVLFIALGGWAFNLLIAAVLGIAAWEFQNMFRQGGYEPAGVALIVGTVILTITRALWGFEHQELILSALILIILGIQTIRFERGSNQAGINFAVTLAGLLYIGWIGSYLISLRMVPNGLWWMLITMPAMSMADAGAFFIGGRLGKHQMAPRTSPKKTWEGYIGGVIVGTLGGWLFAALWHLRAPEILAWHGLLIGFLVTLLSPFGDLAESLFKRQFQIKDSGIIFPGHGGMMDRIDTWLYAGVIGYYIVQLLI